MTHALRYLSHLIGLCDPRSSVVHTPNRKTTIKVDRRNDCFVRSARDRQRIAEHFHRFQLQLRRYFDSDFPHFIVSTKLNTLSNPAYCEF